MSLRAAALYFERPPVCNALGMRRHGNPSKHLTETEELSEETPYVLCALGALCERLNEFSYKRRL